MQVVHCKEREYTHYIGRPSALGNPYSVEIYGRDSCIRRFEDHAWSNQKVMEAIKALPEDAVLGCWCKSKKNPNQACHGDAIVRIWKELHGKAD